MKRGAVGVLPPAAIACALVGVVTAPQVAAQVDGAGSLHSEEFGLTVEWTERWQAEQATEEGGTVSINLWDGRAAVILWAAPAFGGDERLCVDNSEWRLGADRRVSEVQRAGDVAPVMVSGGTSELFRFQFDAEGADEGVDWSRAVWCRTLQPGHSVLLVELEARADVFDEALLAAPDVRITTTDGLAAPEFPLATERDDLTSFWFQQFAAWGGDRYVPPSYVSFSAPRATACDVTSPGDVFYCTGDNAVFFDTAVIDSMSARYGRGITVFLLAHETGHHVAWLLGYTAPCELSQCLTEINNVQWELLADCFAGVWMSNAADRGVLTMADIEDTLVGVADSFSDVDHGSSALRMWWILQGFHLGVDVCVPSDAA